MNRQAMFALFLIILDVGYIVQAFNLPRPFQQGEPGPAFLPLILATILMISCVRILWLELAGTKTTADGDESDVGARVTPRSILLILGTAIFVWAFEPLGYWISTFLYTFGVAWLFEREQKKPIKSSLFITSIIAASVTTVGWLFFVTLFKLGLPTGNF